MAPFSDESWASLKDFSEVAEMASKTAKESALILDGILSHAPILMPLSLPCLWGIEGQER